MSNDGNFQFPSLDTRFLPTIFKVIDMKKFTIMLLFVPFVFVGQNIIAQSIARSTLCSTGATWTNNSAILTSTFGQCPGCGTLSSSDPNGGYITPGFQQSGSDEPCFSTGFASDEVIENCRAIYSFSYTGDADPGTVSFEWDFGPNAIPSTSTEASPTNISFTASGIENIRLDVSDGTCTQIKITSITVQSISTDCDLLVEDVLSPNGDGQNDLWIINSIEQFPENGVSIFNRWGQLVWGKNGYLSDWAGTNKSGEPLPIGAYYYILKLNDTDKQVFSGSVTIVR